VFTNRTAAEPQIELSLGVLDAWMATHLGDSSGSAAQPSKDSPEPTLRSLVSWVSVD
jgi:hypothetical protein